jgi:hypothetical protein
MSQQMDWARVLAALEAQDTRIHAAIAAIREMAGMEAAAPKAAEHDANSPRPYAGLSVAVAAEAYLREQGKPKMSRDIASALQRGGYKTETKGSFTNLVYSRLFLAAKAGKTFTKIGKGPKTKWGLKEWQRGREDQLRIIPTSA